MFECAELDDNNTYKPNLKDINEAAERTYGEACKFFEMVEIYLKNIDFTKLTEKDYYDTCNAIATQLALSCELLLKALYLYENNKSLQKVEEIWNNLKRTRDKLDSNGNKIYDESGRKVIVKGHDLDNLIDLLSEETKIMLETRLLTIPIENTEKHSKVSVNDILRDKKIFSSPEKMPKDKYLGWLELHKRTFEEARYGGQAKNDINVQFLHHLATQIKAVAQFMIYPQNNKVNLTDEQVLILQKEIENLYLIDEKIVSPRLISLIAINEKKHNKLIYLINNPNAVSKIKYLNAKTLTMLIDKLSLSEISFVLSLLDYKNQNSDKKFNIFKNVSNERIIYICLSLKSMKKSVSVALLKEIRMILSLYNKIDNSFTKNSKQNFQKENSSSKKRK